MFNAKNYKEGDLVVWHIPQVPMTQFCVKVDSPKQAKKILDVLADYDSFQFENNIKPDYCNASGLVVLEDGDWTEWYDDFGNDIYEVKFEE